MDELKKYMVSILLGVLIGFLLIHTISLDLVRMDSMEKGAVMDEETALPLKAPSIRSTDRGEMDWSFLPIFILLPLLLALSAYLGSKWALGTS